MVHKIRFGGGAAMVMFASILSFRHYNMEYPTVHEFTIQCHMRTEEFLYSGMGEPFNGMEWCLHNTGLSLMLYAIFGVGGFLVWNSMSKRASPPAKRRQDALDSGAFCSYWQGISGKTRRSLAAATIGFAIAAVSYAVLNAGDDGMSNAESNLVLGNPDAPITIIEFADHRCPSCHEFHETVLPSIRSEYVNTGIAKVEFRAFPLNGPDSVLAAEASFCAGDQKRYHLYHYVMYGRWDYDYERVKWITTHSMEVVASQLGIDRDEFKEMPLFRKISATRGRRVQGGPRHWH